MLKENETLGHRNKIVIVGLKKDDGIKYFPIRLEESSENAVAKLLLLEEKRLSKRNSELRCRKTFLSDEKIHGRRRSQADVRQARNRVDYQVMKNTKIIEAINGMVLEPVIIENISGKEKIVLGKFNLEDKKWWDFLKESGELANLTEISSKYPDSTIMLRELYNIRNRASRAVTVADETEINKDWSVLNKKFQNIDGDMLDHLAPLIIKIRDSIRLPAWYRTSK